MLNSLKRWKDRNQGLHDAADVSDSEMTPPHGWKPVEAFDEVDRLGDNE